MIPSMQSGLSGYTTTEDGVTSQVNQMLLSDIGTAVQVSTEMSALYGAICPIVDQAPNLAGPAGGTLGATLRKYGVAIPKVGTVNVGYLAAHKTAPGSWGKDPNGQPVWNFPPAQPNEPILNPPSGQTIPQFGGSTEPAQNPVVTAIQDLKTYLVGKLGA